MTRRVIIALLLLGASQSVRADFHSRIEADPLVGKVGQPATFTYVHRDAFECPKVFRWEIGRGPGYNEERVFFTATTEGTSIGYTFQEPGEYAVVVAPCGSSSKMLLSFTVVDGAPQAEFTWSPRSPTVNESVQFTDNSTNGPTYWGWTFEQRTHIESKNPSYVFTTAGEKEVTLYVANGGGNSTITHIVTVQESLNADFQWEPDHPAIGQEVQFIDQSSGSPDAWSWEMNNVFFSSERNPKHVFTEAKHYGIKLTVTKGSQSASIFKMINVAASDELDANFSWQPAIPRPNEQVRFLDQSTGSPERWSWVFTDGGTSTEQYPVHTFVREGDYGVSLRVEKGSQQKITTKIVKVRINSDPIAAFTWLPPSPSVNEEVRFTNESGNATEYRWDFNDGTPFSTENNPRHKFARTGTYRVTLRAKNAEGKSHSFSQDIEVSNEEQKPVARFRADPNPATVGQSVQFTDLSTGKPKKWFWDFGGFGKSNEQNPKHIFTAEGTYSVTLIVENSKGRSEPIQVGVVVVKKEKPKPAFQWTPANPSAGIEVTFEDKSENSPKDWFWTFQGGGTLSGKVVRHTFRETGPHSVTLLVSNEHGEATLTRTVEVTDGSLTANFLMVPEQPVVDQPVNFTDQSSGAPDAWQWLIDGRPAGTGRFLTWTFTTGGEHTVELQVSKGGGERLIRQKAFQVLARPKASFSVPAELFAGHPITFTDTSKGQPNKWLWTVDGSTVSTVQALTRTFARPGPVRLTLRVDNAVGSDEFTQNLTIAPKPATERPNITRVQPQLGYCYYDFAPQNALFDVDLFWRGFEPQTVTLGTPRSRGAVIQPTTATSTTLTLDTSALTPGGKEVTPHDLTFFATARNGETSPDEVLRVFTMKLPDDLVESFALRTIAEPRRRTVVRGFAYPPREFEAMVGEVPAIVPFFGGKKLGVKFQLRFEHAFRTDCSSQSATEAEGGATAAGFTISLKGYGTGGYKVSRSEGIRQAEGTSYGFEINGSYEMKEPLLKLLPGLGKFCDVAVIKRICDIAEVKFSVGVGGGAELKYDEKNRPLDIPGTVKMAGGGGFVFGAKLPVTVEVTSNVTATYSFGLPGTPPPAFRKADIIVDATGKLTSWLFSKEFKAAFACSKDGTKEFACGAHAGARSPAVDTVDSLLRLDPVHHGREARSTAGSNVLEDVSPHADPTAAFRGDRTLIVYLTENRSVANSLQRLDLRSISRTAGEPWSEPKAITDDARADFNPAVIYRDDGRAVVVWERLRNESLAATDIIEVEDLKKLTRELEIMAATWDAAANSWSAPQPLTSNDVTDRSPKVAALSDGRVIAVWLRETANGDQQVISRVHQGDAWGAESVVATDLRLADRVVIASRGNEAQLAFTRDKDGKGETSGDTEIATATFRGSAWEAVRDLTNDGVSDVAIDVVYTANDARVIWFRETSLVWQKTAATSPEVVRAGDASMGLLSAQAVSSTAGNVALLWTDPFGSTTDVLTRLWDPSTNRWTSDLALRRTASVEQGISAAFAKADVLRYVTLDTGVETNLVAEEKTLRVDLAAAAPVTGTPSAPAANERVTVTATYRNDGELAVRDVPVQLFAGRNVSGPPLTSIIVPGDWLPGESRRIELSTDYKGVTPVVTIVADAAMVTGDVNPANNSIRYAFANQPPDACFQATAQSGTAPLSIRFDASCSTDAEGAVTVSWIFEDGITASGTTSTRLYEKSGTYPVTLIVSDEMDSRSTRTSTVDVQPQPANWRAASERPALYLPIVGRAAGQAGSYFVSDVSILNTDAGRNLDIDAVYLPDGRADAHRRRITLGGGEMLFARDVLAKLFDAVNGTGSIRLDLSHEHAVAVARTYNDQPTGTAGFSNEALPRSEALRDGETGVVLQHWLPGYRTNVGFTEVAGMASEITVTAYDEQGTLAGSEVFTIGAYDHQQVNGHPLLQQRGRIEVTVRGGSVMAYVSTVDGKTGDPIYQTADRRPARTAAAILIPVAARLIGVNNSTWRTDVRVFNAAPVAQTVTIELRTSGATYTTSFDLGSGATASFDDVIARLFPQLTGNVGGALHIAGSGALMATSRTFNLTPSGTYGLYVPARPAERLLVAGETAYLVQLQENDAYRCNFGMTSFEGNGAVRVRAFDEAGATIGVKEYSVAANQNMQVGRVFADMGVALPLRAAGLEVTVLEGRLFVYASVNDNRTGDGTFIEAAR